MSNRIHIGNVSLALQDFAVSGTAILGIRDSGKTVCAKGIAEQLLQASVPIVVFDPIGKWRYLKTPGEGVRGKGFKIVVAGGESPDLQLTPHSAPEILRACMRENIPLVVDMYDTHLSKSDWRLIVQRCFRILMFENKTIRTIILEEGAEFAPQRVFDGETFAEVEKVARMGGNVQLGLLILNQRSQELNKSVLELCDNLILLRQRGSKAIESVEKWMDRVTPDTAREISKSLPNLGAGDCWVWTKDNENPIRTQTKMCRSLHPDRRAPLKSIASTGSVNTEEFVQTLSTLLPKIVEEAKANDPRELRREIADMKRQLVARQNAAPATTPRIGRIKTVEIEKPVLKDGQLTRIETILGKIEKSMEKAGSLQSAAGDMAREIRTAVGTIRAGPVIPPVPRKPVVHLSPIEVCPSLAKSEKMESENGAAKKLRAGAERMLKALAQWNPGGMGEAQLRAHAGLRKSGTYSAYMTDLRNGGYIEERFGDRGQKEIYATESGIAYCGTLPPAPSTTEEVLQIWRPKLRDGARRMLDILVEANGEPVRKQELFDRAGIVKSGTSSAYLTDLRTARLVVVDRETVKADKDTLFL